MFGGIDKKKLKSLKMSDGPGLAKASSFQYLRWGWHEKPLFTENSKRDWYGKARLTQNVRWDWLC